MKKQDEEILDRIIESLTETGEALGELVKRIGSEVVRELKERGAE